MEIRHKAYKFRIYPNKEQKVLLAKTFGCVRLVYNLMLAEKLFINALLYTLVSRTIDEQIDFIMGEDDDI